MTAPQISAPISAIHKPSCLWRCACGLALVFRRTPDGTPWFYYRGRRREKCPHCKRALHPKEVRRAA